MTEAFDGALFQQAAAVSYDVPTCPASGKPCVQAEYLVELFEDHVDQRTSEGLSTYDYKIIERNGRNLQVRMLELEARIALKGCAGEENGRCPVRNQMDDSVMRQTAVKGLRGLLSFRRK